MFHLEISKLLTSKNLTMKLQRNFGNLIWTFLLQKLIRSLRNMYRGAKYQRLWELTPFHLLRLAATFTCSLLLHVSSAVHNRDERSNCSTRMANITLISISFPDHQEQASHPPTIIKKLNAHMHTIRNTPSSQNCI